MTQVIKRCLKTQLESTFRYMKPYVLHELLNFSWRGGSDRLNTRPYKFGTCDFTLMKLLLESTIAASVIFGHARHSKTVAVPRKIADSSLDFFAMTACVVPANAIHAASPFPLR